MLQITAITKYLALFILPYILIYSLYIQLAGENSPGGGFSAGVIFASAIILYELICNKTIFNKKIYIDLLLVISVLGIMIYILTGLISLFYGDNYLNYYTIHQDKITAEHIGIFLVELGVGLTVSSIMCLIYNIASSND
jgi:multicomponent Na+:H+ antiporter subunit B